MSAILRSSMKVLIGIAIFTGLPWLGWGLVDLRGFLGNPARMAYVVLVIFLQTAMVLLFPTLGSSSVKWKKIVPRQRVAVLLLQVFSLAVVLVAPFSDSRSIGVINDVIFLRYLGLALFMLGFCLMNWAEASLGKQFSIQVSIQEDHQLVTAGPYHYVLHPRYSGIILYNLGLSFLFRSWLAMVLVALLVLVLLWRIRDEEALMSQEFGEVWKRYAQKRRKLIPFLF